MIVAFALPLAYFDAFLVPSFTPRMVLVLLVLPIGALRLTRAAAVLDPAALAAVAMLVAAAIATIVSDAPLWNLRGGFARESSVVFLGGIFSIWALARDTGREGRRLVLAASLIGLAVTGVVGCVQLIVEPSGFLQMIGSRPSGLLVNPVYFGPSMAGAAVFVAHLWARDAIGVRSGAVGLTLFSACANLSGSRAAAIGLLIGLVASLIFADTTRARLQIGGSAVAGFVGSSILTQVTGGRDTLERAAGGSDGRWDVWTYAWDAFRERPLTGHGLGQFRAAVQTHFEPEFVAEYLTGGGGVAWPDAHNVIVQYAVVGGVITVAALLAFVGFAGRQARGPAAWATLALTVSWLLQPVTLVTAPMAAIWLGIACPNPITRTARSADAEPDDPAPDDGSAEEDAGGRTDVLLIAVGCLVALSLFGIDRQLNRALDRGDIQKFTAWAKVAPDDPVIATTMASLSTRFGSRSVGIEWSALAVDLEPDDAVVATDHAIRLFDVGRSDEAVAMIRTALEVDPYNPDALRIAAALGTALDDDELVEIAQTRGCVVVEELCDS